jgi:hypothetical protein
MPTFGRAGNSVCRSSARSAAVDRHHTGECDDWAIAAFVIQAARQALGVETNQTPEEPTVEEPMEPLPPELVYT